MNPNLVLWIYIVLLVLGGLMGFIKAKSKMSLLMSLVFAALLSLVNMGFLQPDYIADILLVFLLLFFGMRFAKSKKFMPGGFMVLLSVLALALRHIRF